MKSVSAAPARQKGRKAYEQVSDRILENVAAGALKDGDRLPGERELAEQMGFSRSAVREALRALEASGVLQRKKGVNGGAYIRKADGAAVTQSMRDVVLRGNLSLHDLTEVRLHLLLAAVALAARRRTELDLRGLEANLELTAAQLEEANRTGDLPAMVGAVGDFWTLIGGATKNRLLSMLIESVTDIQMRGFISLNMPFSTNLLDQRREIIRRIAARDAVGASEWIVRYIAYVHESILQHVGETAPETLGNWLPPEGAADGGFLVPAIATVEPKKGAEDGEVQRLRDENVRLKILLAEAMLATKTEKSR
ncbi:MAG: FadR/GntR family transcriptional regulator [Hyphomonadaceae bacterium]